MTKYYSQEDLRALLEYMSSNPAIPFPNLTKAERERLIEKVMEQFEEEMNRDANPSLVIDLLKDTAENIKPSE